MPANFLDGCSAADTLCDSAEVSLEDLDRAITQTAITPDSELEELTFLQERIGVDSVDAVEAAEAADDCTTCSAAQACQLGQFLSRL